MTVGMDLLAKGASGCFYVGKTIAPAARTSPPKTHRKGYVSGFLISVEGSRERLEIPCNPANAQQYVSTFSKDEITPAENYTCVFFRKGPKNRQRKRQDAARRRQPSGGNPRAATTPPIPIRVGLR
jgi:hypothetical protein